MGASAGDRAALVANSLRNESAHEGGRRIQEPVTAVPRRSLSNRDGRITTEQGERAGHTAVVARLKLAEQHTGCIVNVDHYGRTVGDAGAVVRDGARDFNAGRTARAF